MSSTTEGPRTALVTGGGSGIGRAIARRLAADGFAVAIVDLDAGAASAVTDEIVSTGHLATAYGDVDVSDRAQVDDAVARIRTEMGPPVVLVNNAGIQYFGPFLRVTDEQW